MSADPIEVYLAELRARLRTPAAALILAEAEDHLRESAAAGIAIGMTEREAAEAAISSFGSVRAVVRAHRRPAAAVAAEAGMAAWQTVAIYLLAVACSGLALVILEWAVGVHTRGPAGPVPVRMDPGVWGHLAVEAVGPGACGLAGLALLAGYRRTRLIQRRRGQAPVELFGGYFPLVAAIFMLCFGPAVVVVSAAVLLHPGGDLTLLAAAAVAGSLATALTYAVQMARTLIKQRGDNRTTDQEPDYA